LNPSAQNIKAFIRQQSPLFWYIAEEHKENISKEFLVETVLNYGDLNAVRQLINLMGIDEVADLFFAMINKSDRSKGNFHELTIHFFTLFFNRYAHRNL
jgi:hypothetical protein